MTEPHEIWLAYNAAENASDFDQLMRYVASDLAVTVNGRHAVGSASDDERAMRMLQELYPDYRREVDEALSSADRAIVRWRMIGTAADPAVPPLLVSGCSVVRVADGVMVQAHLYYDGAALDAALGAAGGAS